MYVYVYYIMFYCEEVLGALNRNLLNFLLGRKKNDIVVSLPTSLFLTSGNDGMSD